MQPQGWPPLGLDHSSYSSTLPLALPPPLSWSAPSLPLVEFRSNWRDFCQPMVFKAAAEEENPAFLKTLSMPGEPLTIASIPART